MLNRRIEIRADKTRARCRFSWPTLSPQPLPSSTIDRKSMPDRAELRRAIDFERGRRFVARERESWRTSHAVRPENRVLEAMHTSKGVVHAVRIVDGGEHGAGAHVGARAAEARLARGRSRAANDRAQARGTRRRRSRWLREAEALQLWRPLGMVNAIDYMERTLGYAPRAAQERVRVARALGSLPELERSLSRGELAFSAVRELTRVVTPQTESAWIAAASGKNLRQIEDLVAGHRPGDNPDDPADP